MPAPRTAWWGSLLWGKTVGIVGAGAIGKKVAALCKAFGCTVLAYNRSTVSDPAIDEQVPLEELLKRADIVSLHCPLTADTKGMIGKEQLSLMRKAPSSSTPPGAAFWIPRRWPRRWRRARLPERPAMSLRRSLPC